VVNDFNAIEGRVRLRGVLRQRIKVCELRNKGGISRCEARWRGWPQVAKISTARLRRRRGDEGTDKWGPLVSGCERRRRRRDAEA
jgi:hypothetical protein